MQNITSVQRPVWTRMGWVSGVALLLMAVSAGVAVSLLGNLFVANNAELTAANIRTDQANFQLSIVGWLVTLGLDLVVTVGVYAHFGATKPAWALISSILRLVYSVVLGVAIASLWQINPSDADAAIYQYLTSFYTVWGAGLFIFGFHLLALSALFDPFANKQGLRLAFKILLFLGGLGYIVEQVGKLFSIYELQTFAQSVLILPMILGEVSFAIWLVVSSRTKN